MELAGGAKCQRVPHGLVGTICIAPTECELRNRRNPEGNESEAQTKCDSQIRRQRETADEAEMRALESTGYQRRYGTGGPMRHLIAEKPRMRRP